MALTARTKKRAVLVAFILVVVLPVVTRILGTDAAAPTTAEIPDELAGYRVTYEVVGPAGAYERVLTVRRPFDSAFVDRLSEADGALADRRSVASLGFRAVQADDGTWDAAGGVFFVPLGEVRNAGAAAESLPDHFVELGGSRVLGRECSTLRMSGSPFAVDDLVPVEAAESYSEVCVHSSGVVLAWRDVSSRETTSVGRAISFEVLSTIADSTFSLPDGAIGRTRGDSLEFNVVPDDSPFVDLEPIPAPDDWSHVGRYLLERRDPTTGGLTTMHVVEIYRGASDSSWILRPPVRTVDTSTSTTTTAPVAPGSQTQIVGPSLLARTVSGRSGPVVVGTSGGREVLATFIAIARG